MDQNPEKNVDKRRLNLRPAPKFSSTNQPENKGRPTGSLSLTNLLRKELSANNEIRARELIKGIITTGKKGNSAHSKLVFDRIDGVLAEKTEVEIKPLIIIDDSKQEEPGGE